MGKQENGEKYNNNQEIDEKKRIEQKGMRNINE